MAAQHEFIDIPKDTLYFLVSIHHLIHLNVLSAFPDYLTTGLNSYFNMPQQLRRSSFRNYHFLCIPRVVQDTWNECNGNCDVLLRHTQF